MMRGGGCKSIIKNMKKIVMIIMILAICIILGSQVYATDFLNKVFQDGKTFFDATNASAGTGTVGSALANVIGKNGAIDVFAIIFEVGNLVIFVITIALGLKYIYSGIDGKADIKSSLPNYVLGVVFFYLANSVYDLSSGFMTDILGTGDSYEALANRTYYIINTIANVCAIFGIVLVGVKYMISPADAKADVKKQLMPVALGIVLVYCTLKVLLLVYDIGTQMIT